MAVMTYKTWMARTYVSIVSQRSAKMEAVDKALLQYEARGRKMEDLRQVMLRLREWIAYKGPDWKASDRNKNGAIENLLLQLESEIFGVARNAAIDLAARAALREGQQTSAKRLFENTRLELKLGYKPNYGLGTMEQYTLASGTRSLYKGAVALGAPSLSTDRAAVRSLVHGMEDDLSIAESGMGLGGHGGGSSILAPVRAAEASAISGLESVRNKAKEMMDKVISEHIPATVLADVLKWLHDSGTFGALIAQVVKALIPFHGAVTSGASALFSGFKAAREAWRQYWVRESATFILPGNAKSALDAMYRLMDRNYNSNLRSAAVSAAQCAAQAITTALDVSGTTTAIVGAAGAIAQISHMLFLLGRDFVEKYDANMWLSKSTGVDARVFESHPIIGCYFLLFAETSSILNFSDNFGGPGWKEEVVWMNTNHLVYLRERALGYIKASRFHLVSTDTSRIERRFLVPTMELRTELEKATMSREDFQKRYERQLPSDFSARVGPGVSAGAGSFDNPNGPPPLLRR